MDEYARHHPCFWDQWSGQEKLKLAMFKQCSKTQERAICAKKGEDGKVSYRRRKSTAAAAKLLQSCPTLCDPIDGSPPGSRPWDSSGKNTGVSCHFLLQCVKVKSESEVAQSCRTLSDPVDCSLPGSSVHGIFQASVLEWGAIAFSEEKHYELVIFLFLVNFPISEMFSLNFSSPLS